MRILEAGKEGKSPQNQQEKMLIILTDASVARADTAGTGEITKRMMQKGSRATFCRAAYK